jgi:hypothetical protein
MLHIKSSHKVDKVEVGCGQHCRAQLRAQAKQKVASLSYYTAIKKASFAASRSAKVLTLRLSKPKILYRQAL